MMTERTEETRGVRKEMTGVVLSDKMQKTVIVETSRHVTHAKYRKVVVRRAKFAAHDEKEIASAGDTVRIRESRPLSRTKRWTVIEVLRKAKMRPEEARLLTEPAKAEKGRKA